MRDQFVPDLETHFLENLRGVTPLQQVIRQKAWDRFCELGPPSKDMAGYCYFPFSRFFHESYSLSALPQIPQDRKESLIHPDCRRSHVVFVNGHYAPHYSNTSALPEELVLMPLSDAIQTYGSFLQNRLSRSLVDEHDPMANLNIALIQLGLFVYAPQKLVVDTPIQCLYLTSHDRPHIFNPRIHFFLGKHAQVNWLSEYHCLKDNSYTSNLVMDMALDEGAIFNHHGLINPCHHGFCFEATRVTLKKGSQFNSLTCTSGASSVKQDYKVSLMGEEASCDLKGVALLSENREAHCNILIDHEAPHCTSNQFFKNILTDTAKASFEGKIYVRKKAQKTSAYQLNNNLLLGDRSVANTKPCLEIFADDVKASHGATISQLEPEQLQYMSTRGIEEAEAKKLLLAAFSKDIINKIDYSPVRERAQILVEKLMA